MPLGGPLCHREIHLEASYLLLATSSAVPDSVSPALVKRGDCSRQRTWYQWVSGSVGAVDSHTVILQGGRKEGCCCEAVTTTLKSNTADSAHS